MVMIAGAVIAQDPGNNPILVSPDPTPEVTPVVTIGDETPVVVVPAEDVPGMVSETTLYIVLGGAALLLGGLGLFAHRVIKLVSGLVPPEALPTIYTAADSLYAARDKVFVTLEEKALATSDPFDDELVKAARRSSRGQWAKLKADAKHLGINLPDLPPDVDSTPLVQLSEK